MKIMAQHQAYTRASRASKSPDEVSPEFPQRGTTPGPDDVYDPDFSGRNSRSDSDSARYWDVGSSYGGSSYDGGGGGGYVLF